MADGSQYKNKLSDEQYEVLFRKATEAPFSGKYDATFEPGEYACAACGTVLFDNDAKFDAHCGWPSFYEAFDPAHIRLIEDHSHGMKRTEVVEATTGQLLKPVNVAAN